MGWKPGKQTTGVHADVHTDAVSFPFSGVTLKQADTERTTERTASDVGDGTFTVFLQRDFYVGGGDVALLAALLPRPRPPVAFIFLDDVQHLETQRWDVNAFP